MLLKSTFGLWLVASSVRGGEVYDDFTTYNTSAFSYADHSMGTTDKCKVWYVAFQCIVIASSRELPAR